MGQIVLHEQLFGHGLTGHIDNGLSWADSKALQEAAAGAWQTAVEARGIRTRLEELGWELQEVAGAVYSLEQELSFRLDRQTEIMVEQTRALFAIQQALVTPAKTEAAERVADAAHLLKSHRYATGLDACRASDRGVPRTPRRFSRLPGLRLGQRYGEARTHFEEARDASEGEAPTGMMRDAARLAHADGDHKHARQIVERELPHAKRDVVRASALYDMAIYTAASGDEAVARAHMTAACESITASAAWQRPIWRWTSFQSSVR